MFSRLDHASELRRKKNLQMQSLVCTGCGSFQHPRLASAGGNLSLTAFENFRGPGAEYRHAGHGQMQPVAVYLR
jgi:hypothetical protein